MFQDAKHQKATTNRHNKTKLNYSKTQDSNTKRFYCQSKESRLQNGNYITDVLYSTTIK